MSISCLEMLRWIYGDKNHFVETEVLVSFSENKKYLRQSPVPHGLVEGIIRYRGGLWSHWASRCARKLVARITKSKFLIGVNYQVSINYCERTISSWLIKPVKDEKSTQ